MQWGGFAGGFAQGMNSGISMGKTINEVMKQKKIDDVRKDAVAEAASARGDAVSGMVKDNGAPSPATPATVATASGINVGETPGVTTTAPVVQPETTVIAPDAAAPAAAPVTQGVAPSPAITPAQAAPGMPPEAAPNAPAPAAPTQAPVAAATPQAALSGQAATDARPVSAGLPQKRFSVGDQSFDTREEALAAAGKAAPAQSEFTGKAVAKKLEQHFIETGDIESAEKWGTWAKTKDNERKMETWAGAFKSAQQGDFMGSARQLMKLYPDYNDGMKLVSATAIKDASGKETGFRMTTRDAAGKETTVEHDAQTISRVGLAQMSPQKMFEMDRAEQVAAATAKAKAAADAANDARTLKKELIVEGVKAGTAREAATVKNNRDVENLGIADQLKNANLGAADKRKIETKIDFLKRSEYTEDQIKLLMPAIVGAGDHKKVTDPTERRAIIATELAKDMMFMSKSPADKAKAVDELMSVIHGPSGAAPSPGTPAAAVRTVANPVSPATAAGGLPAAGGKQGIPYMKPDGTIVRLPAR